MQVRVRVCARVRVHAQVCVCVCVPDGRDTRPVLNDLLPDYHANIT